MGRGGLGSALAAVAVYVLALAGCASQSESTGPSAVSTPGDDVLIAQWLADEAEALGIADPPRIDVVRVIALSEFAAVQVDCMQSLGFDATFTADGEGVSYANVPGEHAEPLRLAIYICQAMYPVSPVYLQPLDNDQLRVLYAFRTDQLAECIRSSGFEPPEPPSEALFIEMDGRWSPFDDLSSVLDTVELSSLLEQCPQVPELAELYGE